MNDKRVRETALAAVFVVAAGAFTVAAAVSWPFAIAAAICLGLSLVMWRPR